MDIPSDEDFGIIENLVSMITPQIKNSHKITSNKSN
jgi:hypothetical protein